MAEHWITTKEAAICCECKENTIVQQVVRDQLEYKYVPGKGKNGQQLRILLESLSPEAQCRYAEKRRKSAPRTAEEMLLDKLSQDKRDRLYEKFLITQEYIKFRDGYPRKDHLKQFVKYMKKNYPMFEFNPQQVAKWAKKYEEYGIGGLVDLRGRHNGVKTSLTKEMQEMFLRYYLTDKEPSIQQCYDAVKANFNSEVPSLSSFKRFLYTVPDLTLALYRKGNKFFEDNYLPSIPTDYDSVPSNYEWVADHHVYDVIVNDKGKVGRAWLSTWLDRRSRYIVGYVIRMADPNADTVLDSFVEAVKRCGLPRTIQIDNGKDYTVHDLFNLDNDYSLAAELNLKVRHSIPYNAKAKSIERAFRSIECFNKMLDSYCGDRPEHRAESLGKTNKKIADKIMTFEKFKEIAENVINIYNNTPHSGKGVNGRTPAQCYKEEFKQPIRKVCDKELLMVMRRRTRTVTVTKNGVKFAELDRKEYYTLDFAINYIGKKVYAKYFTSDVKTIHIYSADNDSFLGVLPCKEMFVYGAGAEVSKQVIRENAKAKSEMRKFAKSAYPHDTTVPTIEEIYEKRSKAFGDLDLSGIPTVNYFEADKRSELEHIRAEEQTIQAVASHEFVLPIDEDDDYESKLSRRYSNG